jgi:hypothetical protein
MPDSPGPCGVDSLHFGRTTTLNVAAHRAPASGSDPSRDHDGRERDGRLALKPRDAPAELATERDNTRKQLDGMLKELAGTGSDT